MFNKLIITIFSLLTLALAQPSCNLSNITTATRIAPAMFPYTSPTSGITVSATWTCPTLGNTSYTCGGTSFACSPTAWWINGAAQVITLTFSCPVTEFSMVFNGTNNTEEFYFNASTGSVTLSDFCATGFALTGGGNQLLCSSASATGNMVKVNNPTGSTIYTITHNGLGSGSRISLLDCFTCGPLPLVSGSLMASYHIDSDRTALTWKANPDAGTEVIFFAEHSIDGVSWQNIGSVNTIPSDQQQRFQLHHYAPGTGVHHYRIRQQDTQGNYVYSEVQTVTIEQVPGTFMVFPNPSSGLVHILTGTAHAVAEVFSPAGKMIFQTTCDGACDLDLGNLPSGIYILELTRTDGERIHSRIGIE